MKYTKLITAFFSWCMIGYMSIAYAAVTAWPNFDSKYKFEIYKTLGAEPTDPFWMHLHQGMMGFESVGLAIEITANSPVPLDPSAIPPGNQVRYMIREIPISNWLDAPWTFVLNITNPALEQLLDGIHAITIEVQGPNRDQIRPLAVYLHLARGKSIDPTVPIIAHNATSVYDDYENYNSQGPGIVYVNRSDRHNQGYPMDSTVIPWHLPPYESDLYQEEMQPHSDLFLPVQMWWEEPKGTISEGVTFIRSIGSKFGGEHTTHLYNWIDFGGPRSTSEFGFSGHKNLPYKDGPRGIGWMSPFVTGQVDSTGGLAFVEAGGPLRYLSATGELTTVAGWRVMPGKDPVWIQKPLDSIRQNMELRGNWINGQYTDLALRGFHYPTDVTIDPQNETIWDIAGFGDNCIWKVVIIDRITWNATVEVFAGSVTHQASFADGLGTSARFYNPSSLIFDPICDCIYVADQQNNSIRKITRNGVVTTIFGSPGMGVRLASRGLPTGIINPSTGGYGCTDSPFPMQCYDEVANRSVSKLDVSTVEAASGVKPDIYLPITIRVDSKGNLVILDMGFATISRINPITGETKLLGFIPGRYDRFVPGWAWLDVDRFGNSGPLDSIYWVQGVGSGPMESEGPNNLYHVNELFAWVPAEGGLSRWVVTRDDQSHPDGWGRLQQTDIPHYPWLVAIDPRGAVFVSGMGEHGITRVRSRRQTDPFPTNLGEFGTSEYLWLKGEQVGGHSFSFKFGYGGHNYLGFPDTWSLQPGVTDAELITMFEIPQTIQDTPVRLAGLLNFIRLNSGKQLTTSPIPPDTQSPTIPTNLMANNVTQTSVHLSWDASTDNVQVKEYLIYRNNIFLANTMSIMYDDTFLLPLTLYTYKIQAKDTSGNLSQNIEINITTLDDSIVIPPFVTKVGLTAQWILHDKTRVSCIAIGKSRQMILEEINIFMQDKQ